VDSDLATYLDRVVERMRGLEAVWLIGSAAKGAYVSGRSDVDVIGVSSGPLSEEDRRAIAADLAHEHLPCPARKLELAIYTRAQLEHPAADIQPELNLNTGADEHSVEPADSFWFVIDLAMARERGVSLHGPDPAELIGEVPRAAILDALADSVDWYAGVDPESPDALLNAERARGYVEEGVWSSKRQA
jgi:hypothetical protein